MIDFKIDELFKHLKLGAYHHYFGEPALGESLLATIEKEPLIVKKAPRDSVEFANQSHVIDSTKQEAVHWLVEFVITSYSIHYTKLYDQSVLCKK